MLTGSQTKPTQAYVLFRSDSDGKFDSKQNEAAIEHGAWKLMQLTK